MNAAVGPDWACTDYVRASGRSMRPLIRDGALIALERVAPDGLTPGDLMVFRREGRLIAHRLLAARGRGAELELREKGDHTRRADWIPGSALVGRAIELRQGGQRRNLKVAPGRRIRGLTFLSCLEADAVERYVASRARGGGLGRLRGLLLPLALALAPLRWLLLRMLLTVYPRSVVAEDPGAVRCVLRLFQGLFAESDAAGAGGAALVDGVAAAESAAAHGLAPLLAAAGRGSGAGLLPPNVAGPLRRQSYRIALDHERARPALCAVARALDEVKIAYALLKGPALYERLYRDRFPREYEDFDVLVAPHELDAALAALRAAGYRDHSDATRRAFLRRFHFHLALTSPRPGWPPVELHWAMVDRANLHRLPDGAGLSRRRTFGDGENRCSVLSPEDELIYLCLHAAKHAPLNDVGLRRGAGAAWFCRPVTGNRLIWFADIGLLLQREFDGLDWSALRERLAAWNVAGEVGDLLRVLQILAPDSRAGAALTRLGLPSETPEDLRQRERTADRPGAGRRMDWALRMHPVVLFRPIRLLLAVRLFFPSPARLSAYYGLRSRRALIGRYVAHPFHMAGRLLVRPGPPSAAENRGIPVA